MNLFGRELDGMQIASLVSLLLVLVFWLLALRREQGWSRWFRQWEADRKARRDAEIEAGGGAPSGQADDKPGGPPRGPWG